MDSNNSPKNQPKSLPVIEDPIKLAWENVVLNELPPGGEIRSEILMSWHRCRKAGVDPFSKVSQVLSNNELRSLIQRNHDLIEISKPVMEMMEISVRGTGFIITLNCPALVYVSVRPPLRV